MLWGLLVKMSYFGKVKLYDKDTHNLEFIEKGDAIQVLTKAINYIRAKDRSFIVKDFIAFDKKMSKLFFHEEQENGGKR